MQSERSGEAPATYGQGGGWGPPGGGYPPGGYGPPGAPPGGYGPPGAPPGGYGPPGGGGFAPAPPGGFAPPAGGKPITGSKQTMAMHAMTIDPTTGMPRGEKPPASTAAVISLVCGVLLCLGPLTGIPAIVAGFIGRSAAKKDPANVGGSTMALIGIILGVLNLLGSVAYFLFAFVLAVAS